MTHEITPAPEKPAKSGWHRVRTFALVTALVVGSGLTGAYVSQSVHAQGFGMGPGFGPGFGHRGIMGRAFDPAAAEDRADRMVRHLSVEIDATADQQEKLRTIARGAVKDLVPMRAKAQAARERAEALLVQPNLSRTDIEAFRTEQMALADAFTKRVAQALGDASDVITPDQRKKLDALIAARRDSRHWWHRG
ncbi:MAG: Spy/CpxP family protein refolding chaperone [Xanthobacteraceae bacterium]